MTNPKAKQIYCVIATWPHDCSGNPQEFFIGQFEDKSYHILGCRPKGLSYLLSDERQSNDDWGTLTLPEEISDLEKLPYDTELTLRHPHLDITTKIRVEKIEYKLK
jgi:hypothetical protein